MSPTMAASRKRKGTTGPTPFVSAKPGIFRRWLLPTMAAATTGFLVIRAFTPIDLWPLAFVALFPLYLAVREMSLPRAILFGWIAGFVANLLGFDWAGQVIRDFAHLSRADALKIVLGVCAYQGVVFALWAGACSVLHRRVGLALVFVAPLAMAMAEAAVPFVFKWYLAVTVWRAWPMIQVAELGGPPAVSALVVLANVLVAEFALSGLRRQRPARSAWTGAAVLVVVLALGMARAQHVTSLRKQAPALRVGLVQPNFGIVPVQERALNGDRHIDVLRRATTEASARGAQLVVWPESSWPYLLDRELEREFAPGHPWELRPGVPCRLLMGALTHEFGTGEIYNSAVLVSESGAIVGRYDKTHLIPFGEYIPMEERFPEWAERTRERLPEAPQIEPGDGAQVLKDGELRIAPMICSEELLSDYVKWADRPNLLVSLVNDAWFGTGPAPRHHMALSVFRSVETRRDLVRATNTGVSAVVEATGRVQAHGPLVAGALGSRPDVVVGDVALLETFSSGPFTVALFPYACFLLLVAVLLARAWPK